MKMKLAVVITKKKKKLAYTPRYLVDGPRTRSYYLRVDIFDSRYNSTHPTSRRASERLRVRERKRERIHFTLPVTFARRNQRVSDRRCPWKQCQYFYWSQRRVQSILAAHLVLQQPHHACCERCSFLWRLQLCGPTQPKSTTTYFSQPSKRCKPGRFGGWVEGKCECESWSTAARLQSKKRRLQSNENHHQTKQFYKERGYIRRQRMRVNEMQKPMPEGRNTQSTGKIDKKYT